MWNSPNKCGISTTKIRNEQIKILIQQAITLNKIDFQ